MASRARSWSLVTVWFAAGFLAAVTLLVGGAVVRGGRVLVVASGSMAPAVRTGDVIVVTAAAPTKVRVGQVVTFRDPTRRNRLVSHRVRAMTVTDGRVDFVTKGDVNQSVERWSVAANGRVGRVLWRVPSLGYAVDAVRSRPGQIGFVALPALLLGLTELVVMWRKPPPQRRRDAPRSLVVELEPVAPRVAGWDDVLEDLADRIEAVFGQDQRVVMVDEARYVVVLDTDRDGAELSRRLRQALAAPLVGRDVGPVEARVTEAVPG